MKSFEFGSVIPLQKPTEIEEYYFHIISLYYPLPYALMKNGICQKQHFVFFKRPPSPLVPTRQLNTNPLFGCIGK